MAWSAGWNIAGYLPETDPSVFADFEDARGYLSDVIERWWEQDAEYEFVDDEYRPVHEALHSAATGEEFHSFKDYRSGSIHFWIVEVADSELEREDEYV